MIILPAIDLKDGRCVRLYKGDFSTAYQVADDPSQMATAFADAGARMLHIVDLDGALKGAGKNRTVVQNILSAVGDRLRIELGGGIRSMQAIEEALKLGVYRVVLGTAAAENIEFLKEAVSKYKNHIAVGIDALDGRVKTAGWTEDSGMNYLSLAREMEACGIKTIIFTDIDTDGMLGGPGLTRLKALRNALSCDLVASGGISDIGDIRRLKQAGMNAAIIGKALYAGAIDLKTVISEAGEQCLPNE
jgi:phosphoribosylformimino-5-aminoimidazole carboxamide ribotide isomerase